jgi:ABC-2 type transport system permease protein
MWRRIITLLKKEFIQVLRDRRMRVFLFLPPLVQLMAFGYAANLDVRHIRSGVLDLDNTPESRKVLDRFKGSNLFDAIRQPRDFKEMTRFLDKSEISAGIVIWPGFGSDLRGKDTAYIQILVDGTDSTTAQVVMAYAEGIVQSFAREEVRHRLNRITGRLPYDTARKIELMMQGVSVESRLWFNPDLASKDFFLPGIIAQVITVMTVMLTAISIVREREIGTLEQLLVTPIKPFEFILGKTLPFAIVGFLDMILITVAAVFWFEVPIRGSITLLTLFTMLFLLNTLGIGLFISTISNTQQQAMTSAFLFLFPGTLLSGFIFPIHNMPWPIQYITYLNPLRYVIIAFRSIFLKGVDLDLLVNQLWPLLILGTGIMILSVRKVRQGLE